MEAYTTEEQQVEAIKKWFKENGASTLLTISIGLAVVFGWQAWTSSQEENHQAASSIYQDMTEALVLLNNPEDAEKHARTVRHLGEQLIKEHTGLMYAHFAALAIAKLEVDKGNFSAGAERLQWVLDQSSDESLRNVAKVRMARVLSAQEKYDEALVLLSSPLDASISALAEEIKGDIYVQMGAVFEARMAYQRSIDVAASKGSQKDALVQMKLDDLAVSPELATE